MPWHFSTHPAIQSTLHAPVVPPTRERPGAPPSITPAARIAIQLHAALRVGLLLPLLLPQHMYAPDRVLHFPAPPEYEIPYRCSLSVPAVPTRTRPAAAPPTAPPTPGRTRSDPLAALAAPRAAPASPMLP